MKWALITVLLIWSIVVTIQLESYEIKLREPSYEKVLSIMDEVPDVRGNCCDKSNTIQNYFYALGYQCYIVITNRSNGDGHISVAFNTTGERFEYIKLLEFNYFEPETRKEYFIAVGQIWDPPGIVFWGSQANPENRVITQLTIVR